MPPTGAWKSRPAVGALIFTIPVCMFWATRRVASKSRPCTLPVKPKRTAFAEVIASPTVFALITPAIGPKVSSWFNGSFASKSQINVGV
ncbi:unannotated protein [freshwater metagenome]|uniref:Unannotated protein n=1 Tax=freshwater metagenome TaxID=449393 RepID=A0A6J7SCU9_9ZZZZ